MAVQRHGRTAPPPLMAPTPGTPRSAAVGSAAHERVEDRPQRSEMYCAGGDVRSATGVRRGPAVLLSLYPPPPPPAPRRWMPRVNGTGLQPRLRDGRPPE